MSRPYYLMKSGKPRDVVSAWVVSGGDDLIEDVEDWCEQDTTFAEENGYVLHEIVPVPLRKGEAALLLRFRKSASYDERERIDAAVAALEELHAHWVDREPDVVAELPAIVAALRGDSHRGK